MISSIVFKGCYTVNANKTNKIKIDDNILSIDSDIPFVRYRFEKYGEQQIEFIRQTKQRFGRSTHLVEVNIDNDVENTLQRVIELGNVAKYLYIDVTEEDVQRGCLAGEELLENIRKTAQYMPYVDRIMLRDKSVTLDTCTAQKIITQIIGIVKSTGYACKNNNDFGICSSPLSFGESACLTAVKARELMSKYSEIADVALPSANHQCMNCCGCIRYMIVDRDIEAPADAVKSTKEKKAKSEKQSESKEKPKVKIGVQPGRFTL